MDIVRRTRPGGASRDGARRRHAFLLHRRRTGRLQHSLEQHATVGRRGGELDPRRETAAAVAEYAPGRLPHDRQPRVAALALGDADPRTNERAGMPHRFERLRLRRIVEAREHRAAQDVVRRRRPVAFPRAQRRYVLADRAELDVVELAVFSVRGAIRQQVVRARVGREGAQTGIEIAGDGPAVGVGGDQPRRLDRLLRRLARIERVDGDGRAVRGSNDAVQRRQILSAAALRSQDRFGDHEQRLPPLDRPSPSVPS